MAEKREGRFVTNLVEFFLRVYCYISTAIRHHPQLTCYFVVATGCVIAAIRKDQLAWRAEDFDAPKYAEWNDSQRRFARSIIIFKNDVITDATRSTLEASNYLNSSTNDKNICDRRTFSR